MELLAGIFIFIIISLAAACKGDYSGVEAILKVVVIGVMMFAMMWVAAEAPVLFMICFFAFVIYAVSRKKAKK